MHYANFLEYFNPLELDYCITYKSYLIYWQSNNVKTLWTYWEFKDFFIKEKELIDGNKEYKIEHAIRKLFKNY